MISRLLTLLLCLSSASTCWGVTWYTVELIAFQHLSADGLYAETWPENVGEPETHKALRLTRSGELSLEGEEESSGVGGPYAFQLLDSTQHSLTDVSNRLKWSEGYRPLLHIAWRQPGFSRSESRTVYIHSQLPNRYRSAGGAGDMVISGTLRLSRARYLHVDADLVHVRDADTADAAAYRMRQSRRMRSREVHYLDHPAFGIIVLVTPYEPVEVFSEEETE